MVTLYIVVPCYNESEVLPETTKRLSDKMERLVTDRTVSPESKILFVDDGSKDTTWRMIEEYHSQIRYVTGLKLSRNRGHQNALLAGLMTAKEYADVIISMDADLQDDIDAVDAFIAKYNEGNDVVYGVRSSRKTDTFFKRFTATSFYKLMRFFGAEIVYNHADYRLMSKRALEALEEFRETNLFLRGIVPLIGFQSASVYYARNERFAGESKYPLKKMLGFAAEGIFSFSVRPIKMIGTIGLLIFAVSIAMLVYALISFLAGSTVPGWTSILFSVWALGGLQLLAISVIGEYIGKIYLETKQRPKFIIDRYLG
jgi:Glycosyltransferases involved in cell wall biogenesis